MSDISVFFRPNRSRACGTKGNLFFLKKKKKTMGDSLLRFDFIARFRNEDHYECFKRWQQSHDDWVELCYESDRRFSNRESHEYPSFYHSIVVFASQRVIDLITGSNYYNGPRDDDESEKNLVLVRM